MRRPRREAWSFLCVLKCSVSSPMRVLKMAIWTSGDPVSVSWVRYWSIRAVFFSRANTASGALLLFFIVCCYAIKNNTRRTRPPSVMLARAGVPANNTLSVRGFSQNRRPDYAGRRGRGDSLSGSEVQCCHPSQPRKITSGGLLGGVSGRESDRRGRGRLQPVELRLFPLLLFRFLLLEFFRTLHRQRT